MKRILVAVLFAINVAAQQSEVIEVQITNLDVVVTDNKGKRVTGLTKDDFEVLEDGKAQPISNFSEISRTSTGTTETVQPAPRRILLIVDNGSIAFSARRKIFDATRAALERLLIGPSDRIAIATVARSVKERLPWTSDKAAVLSTLATLEKDTILPNPNLLDFERKLETIEYDAAQAGMAAATRPEPRDPNAPPESNPGRMDGGTGGSGGGYKSLPEVDFNEIISAGRNYASTTTNENKQTLSSLHAAITAFAGVQGGRKIAILVGGGLPLNAAEAIFAKIQTVKDHAVRDGNRGFKGASSVSTLTQVAPFDITPLVDSLAATARAKGVAFYAVNPEFGDRQTSGIAARASGDRMAEFAATKGMLDGYQRLASATGGAAMIGRPADQILTEIMNDLDSYYSIGYRASGPLNPKSQIAVKMRKGLSARATFSSGTISRDWEVSDQVLANHVLEPENPLSISLVMDPPVVEGDKKKIAMKVLIPIDSLKLIKDGSDYLASFAVFISLGSAGGDGAPPNRQEQSFRWPENTLSQVKGKTIGFAVPLEVGADRDRVSVGVLDQNSGEAGFTTAMLQ
jgi:VWFA-related protein